MDWLRELRANEPLRTTIYPMLVTIAGMLVVSGRVDADTSNLVLGIVGALLGIVGTEAARSQVTPAPGRHSR